jgi:predicted nucleic acid-binding protein
MSKSKLLIFVDCNVLIEGFLMPLHSAGGIMVLAANKHVDLITCKLVVDDVDKEILERAEEKNDYELVGAWTKLLDEVRLRIVPNPEAVLVKETLDKYWGIMRHKADIPVLASAIELGPDLILSDNRTHFNDAVSERSGIQIMSCEEFLANLIAGKIQGLKVTTK